MQGFVATIEIKVSIAAEWNWELHLPVKRQKINAKVQISLQGCFAWMSIAWKLREGKACNQIFSGKRAWPMPALSPWEYYEPLELIYIYLLKPMFNP